MGKAHDLLNIVSNGDGFDNNRSIERVILSASRVTLAEGQLLLDPSGVFAGRDEHKHLDGMVTGLVIAPQLKMQEGVCLPMNGLEGALMKPPFDFVLTIESDCTTIATGDIALPVVGRPVGQAIGPPRLGGAAYKDDSRPAAVGILAAKQGHRNIAIHG